jgi:type IV pilus assembly protein PilM
VFDFLWKGNRQPIALDIGSDSVKMLQMQQVDAVVSVGACGRWRFPDNAPADPAQRKGLVVAAVREMLKTGDFKGRRVISALSGSQLCIKNVRVPHMNDEELRQALLWEAKERFEFNVPEDQLAYLNAGEVRQGNEVRDEIILLAAPPAVLDEHLELLDAMGLRPEHIDAEPVALFRVFERFLRRSADEQIVSVIVEIGHSATRVVVARGKQIVFIKVIDIGGRKFTEVVASHLNLSISEASDIRTRIMQEDVSTDRKNMPLEAQRQADPNSLQWTVYDAVRAEVETLAKEISLCLRYCSVTFRGLRCPSVLLTGGEAYDPAVFELLTQQLGVECEVGQPLRGFDISGLELSNRRGKLAEWAVCAGLGIRGMNIKATFKEGGHGESRLSA